MLSIYSIFNIVALLFAFLRIIVAFFAFSIISQSSFLYGKYFCSICGDWLVLVLICNSFFVIL